MMLNLGLSSSTIDLIRRALLVAAIVFLLTRDRNLFFLSLGVYMIIGGMLSYQAGDSITALLKAVVGLLLVVRVM